MYVGLAGENVSLSVDFPGAASFRSSGYANIITNSTYTGGVVRQIGQLSFSRVFEAGHYGIPSLLISSSPQSNIY